MIKGIIISICIGAIAGFTLRVVVDSISKILNK